MIYETVSYKPTYTFYAANREVAALTILLLSTSLGARCDSERNIDIPVTADGSPEKWYTATFGRSTVDGLIELGDEVKKSLRSFVAGGFQKRIAYMMETSPIVTDDKRNEFRKNWNRFYEGVPNLAETADNVASQIDAAINKTLMREEKMDT